jgi:hypothetical protein
MTGMKKELVVTDFGVGETVNICTDAKRGKMAMIHL